MARNNGVGRLYRIQSKILEIRESKSKHFCNVCFETNCDHKKGFCNQNDAITALEWWIRVVVSESDEILVLGDDDQFVIPKFPRPIGRRLEYKYDHFPILDQEMVLIHATSTGNLFFTEDGEEFNALDVGQLKNGTYWGYVYNGRFYLLSTFNNGEWFNSRQGLETTKDLPIDAPYSGFLHIPKGRFTYEEFQEALVLT